VLRVIPDQQDGVHDWNKQISNFIELGSLVGQGVEQLGESLKILVVLIGLRSCSLNFFLQLAEWASVGRFILLKEFENLLDLLGVQLEANGVQVLTLVFPEFDLSQWIWVVSIFECTLWVLLENILDLLGPVNDGIFKEEGLVFTGSLLA
jgi:hypothetical protein